MRKFVLFAALGAAVFAAAPGQAQSPNAYRWCALNGDRSGSTSCAFQTRAQCMASISGRGGSCIQNPSFRGGQRLR
jgi:hypothetical protein